MVELGFLLEGCGLPIKHPQGLGSQADRTATNQWVLYQGSAIASLELSLAPQTLNGNQGQERTGALLSK